MELQGKYGKAVVYASIIDPESIAQIIGLLNQPYAATAHTRLMPDVHAGAGCTIGTTMHISDKVCPNLVGVDIGCGMEVVKIAGHELDFAKLDQVIRTQIPSGFSIRENEHPLTKTIDLTQLVCKQKVNIDHAMHSLGTLGGGNHFIEVDEDSNGDHYLVIHSGSRHLGVEVATHYQKRAWDELTRYTKQEIDQLIADMKAQGRAKEISQTLRSIGQKNTETPESLAYVQGQALEDYLHDMHICQQFAMLNRKAMADTIVNAMGWTVTETFTTIHNYIDMDTKILRKGAVSAQKGEKLIIPMNMRDGSLICIGKGNEDWNYSAPHEAGRLMSRSKAKESIDLKAFQETMQGIWTTSVSQSTLDESPMAYKPIDAILDQIDETVELLDIVHPVYNFKAS